MRQLAVLAACVLLGCPSAPEQAATTATAAAAKVGTTAATGPTGQAAKPARGSECPADDRFANLDWAPPSRLALRLDRRAPKAAELLAASNKQLEALGLPVYASFDLKQLPFAVPTVESVATELGLSPAEHMLLHGPEGRSVWAMPANCDTAPLEALATAAWGLRFRNQGGARVANAGSDPQRPMPFDMIIVEGELVVLAPGGSAAAISRWLRGGAAAMDDLTRVRAGEAMATLPSAPLQMRIEGAALAAEGSGEARAFVMRDATAGWAPVVPSAAP